MRGSGEAPSRLGRNAAALAAITLAALAAAACGRGDGSAPAASGSVGAGSGSSAPARLVVELDWVPNPDHVGLYFAQDRGYFADEGLTVEYHSPSNAADPIKLVALNRVDLAISYEPEMFYGQQSELPITAVATVVPVPLNSMIVSPDASVTQLREMAHRSVGVTGIPSDDAFYLTMLKTAGLSEADVTKVDVGFNLVPSLLAGKVDAIIGGYRNVEAIQVERESGSEPTVFPADELGVPTYAELVVVANSERLGNDEAYADAVRRFVASLVRGTDAAVGDPARATAIMKRVTQYSPKFLDESVPYTLALLKPVPGSRTGCIDTSAWQSFGSWMRSNELIASTPDAPAISTNRYLPYSCP